MLTDIEIAQNAKMKPIGEIASDIGISEDYLEYYGKYKAKISFDCIDAVKDNKDGKLILVTAVNPTPAGEGKTTTLYSVIDSLDSINSLFDGLVYVSIFKGIIIYIVCILFLSIELTIAFLKFISLKRLEYSLTKAFFKYSSVSFANS